MVRARFLARDASSRSPLLTAPPSPCSCGASIHRRYQKSERSSLSPTVSLLRRAQLHMGEQRCRRPPCVHTAKAGVRRCPLQSTLYTASVCRRCEAHQKRALMHVSGSITLCLPREKAECAAHTSRRRERARGRKSLGLHITWPSAPGKLNRFFPAPIHLSVICGVASYVLQSFSPHCCARSSRVCFPRDAGHRHPHSLAETLQRDKGGRHL